MDKKEILIVLICVFFIGCSNSGNVNCKKVFDEYYERNIAAFMSTIPADVDSVIARKRCECILDKLYCIDSTFVLMDGDDLENFIKMNIDVIKQCDSIINCTENDYHIISD